MKFSTIMAVLAVAIAVTTSGCKYNKAAGGAGVGADDLSANGSDISGASLDEGDIGMAGESRFEDMYTKCTDVAFSPVYFAFDSSVVPQDQLSKVDEVVQHLTERTDRVVVVEGHCDERGSNEYNLALGENRSVIVRDCLVQSGIAADRIQTRSYGEEKPVDEGHEESAWAVNRRAEFGIYQK
jgi:peptidoglycan-associated lipoprotein